MLHKKTREPGKTYHASDVVEPLVQHWKAGWRVNTDSSLWGRLVLIHLRDSSFWHSVWLCSIFFWTSEIFLSISFNSESDTSGKLAYIHVQVINKGSLKMEGMKWRKHRKWPRQVDWFVIDEVGTYNQEVGLIRLEYNNTNLISNVDLLLSIDLFF